MNGYLQPMNGQGFAAFTQAAEAAGWYQFDTPHRNVLLPAIPGITIPPDAQGFMIQAKTDLHYMFSPSGAVGGATGSFTLPAGGYMMHPGADSLARFCMLMPASGAQFVVTFYSGSIGPIPMINIPATGGITPPPPPGVGALPTINTLWVMKNSGGYGGDDATGTRNRMDLPFLTPEAAEAAAVAGDEIIMLAGDYALTTTLGKNGVKYTRWGANLSRATGPVFTANAISFEVRGFGTLTCGSAAGYVIDALNAGTVTVDGTLISTGGGARCATGSTVVINGNITNAALSGAFCGIGTLTVNGSITATGTGTGTRSASATSNLIVNGNIVAASGIGARCDGGSHRINGNVNTTTGVAAQCSDGYQEVTGTARSTGNYGAYCNGATAVQIISEDAISDTNYGADCSSGEQTIGRDAIVTASGSGNAAYCGATGVQHIMRNAVNEGVGAATSTTTAGALQYVHGDARNVSGACCRSTGGYTKVYGDAYSETERAVLAQGGTVEIMGTAISDAYLAIDINANGTCILWGGATTNLAASEAITLSAAGDTLILRGAAYVRNDGSGNAIEGAAGTVTSYGAYGSAPIAGGITVNGTYTVL